ncbi:MAG: 3-oxoacyl-[acyl-carrier-protein] reductase [Candidatus Krumholzibacteria bacterium]|nr:3-oxoacyl-[acyl-carrier-protein] reductase [Candidatus Krumholzibacteria bacterium]
MDFEGKIGFVTGGSRGIGREIALQMAKRGAAVAIVSRGKDDAERVASEIESLGVKARGYACDVSSIDEASRVAQSAIEDLGTPDFLVNNAGIVRDKLILRMTPEDWNQVIATNLTGVYNFVRVFSPHFIKKRSGRIVNISSVIGLVGNAGQTSYAASKAGVIGLTKSLAKEFAPRGITVNAVAPGYIATAMTNDLGEEIQTKMLEMIPLRRFGTVEDVANVVIFLLSGMADYLTGHVINCDGGMVMG